MTKPEAFPTLTGGNPVDVSHNERIETNGFMPRRKATPPLQFPMPAGIYSFVVFLPD